MRSLYGSSSTIIASYCIVSKMSQFGNGKAARTIHDIHIVDLTVLLGFCPIGINVQYNEVCVRVAQSLFL